MNKEDVKVISAYLTKLGIEHEATDHNILINRDSIVNKVHGKHEHDSYDNLRHSLNKEFHEQYFYASRTDEWMMLDKMEHIAIH